ncbi:uncharacterized protein [Diadema antillarum]|uniref:uncharacterized protein n=1 Tax=Diadema antillarum TaxID=105358 RepID=UPI003A851823
MHLKYPHTSKFFTWEELSCLTSALGYPNGTLRRCIPADHMIRKDGVSYREMLKLIDLKYFNEALHLSVNMHTADYNINVLRKSMNLLNHKFLTFDELNDVRVAFQVYEAGDIKGMIIDKHTLMRTLKLCGRTIAPLKLMHRVKHMEERLDEPGRIQFYEFLDLIVLCFLTKDVVLPETKCGPLDKTWRKLFELDDFDKVFSTWDERLEEHLDREFIGTERNYGHEILGSKRIPRESSVDPSLRKTQVRFHSRRYRELKTSVTQSHGQVRGTKAGHVRARPVSAPGVDDFRIPVHCPIFEKRPHTVAESSSTPAPSLSSSRIASAHSDSQKSDLESVRNVDPRLKLLKAIHDRKTLQSAPSSLDAPGLRFKPPQSMLPAELEANRRQQPPPIHGQGDEDMARPIRRKAKRPETRQVVTEQDVWDRQHVLDSLQYEIETLEERTMQSLHSQLKKLLPHHRFKSASLKQREAEELENARVAKIEAEKLRRQRKRDAKKAAAESLQRLVHPTPRAYHALHDKTCDARSQGPGSTRHSTSTSKRGTKPLLLLDGQKVLVDGSESSLPMERTTLDNVSSVGSIEDAASSVAQTTDIGHHAPVLPRPGRSTTSHSSSYDPAKFRESRMGTAALLHSYFHESDATSEDVDDDEGIGTLPASEMRTDTMEGARPTEEGDKDEEDAGVGTEDHSIGRRSSSISMTDESGKQRSRRPVQKVKTPLAQNLQFERTKLTRKVKIGEDEELWLHGFPLSEIDRLTFKSTDDRSELNPLTQSLSSIYSKN